MYKSIKFNIASKCAKLLTHGTNSVIMNIFSKEIVYLFPEVTVCVVKWIFCYKEGILMETDLFPAILCRILNILP